ncbi:endopeptidase La [Mycoplasma nasistruthionis]
MKGKLEDMKIAPLINLDPKYVAIPKGYQKVSVKTGGSMQLQIGLSVGDELDLETKKLLKDMKINSKDYVTNRVILTYENDESALQHYLDYTVDGDNVVGSYAVYARITSMDVDGKDKWALGLEIISPVLIHEVFEKEPLDGIVVKFAKFSTQNEEVWNHKNSAFYVDSDVAVKLSTLLETLNKTNAFSPNVDEMGGGYLTDLFQEPTLTNADYDLPVVPDSMSIFDGFERLILEGYSGNISPDSDEFKKVLLNTVYNSLSVEKFPDKLRLLELPPRIPVVAAVLGKLSEYLVNSMELDGKINTKMSDRLKKQQTEFYLREKIKTAQEMLEDIDAPVEKDDYALALEDKVLSQMYPENIQKIIKDETKRFSEMVAVSPEANIAKTYVQNLKQLPWRKTQKEFLDINRTREVLDNNHYGLQEVKERITEYLAVIINLKNQSKSSKEKLLDIKDTDYQVDLELFTGKENEVHKREFNNVPILTLVGPPGTGKTSLSKAIAEALNRKFVKISLGGVHDESEIRGHRRTYVGAMPGKIIKGIKQAGVSNPVILLDEIDKMASDFKGDPASAMLEVLDPEQNTRFQDHYLEVEYDLSKCIFIATANYFEKIPAALIDRVEVIDLSAYTLNEKVEIATTHLMPKVLKQAGLKPEMMQLSSEVLKYVIKHYTREAGVRGLKRVLDKIARKIVVKQMDNKKLKKYVVSIEDISDLLGIIQYRDEQPETETEPGTVTGLAYTSFGGSTLPIEVTTHKGKGEIKLTGSLKEVMQESAKIALTYVRANAEKFEIPSDFNFDETTIHIHVPEGAVPKDGPSAGVTFTTAIISALTKRVVPSTYAMTGEITLRGKVLEIGGLKEKSFAATQKGVKTVFIPENNVKNLKDIPDEIKSELTYVPVKNYSEIYDVIFGNKKPLNKVTFKNK